MNIKKLSISALTALSLMLPTTGCHDEPDIFNTDPTIETEEGKRITYFNIAPELLASENIEVFTQANLKSGFSDFRSFPLRAERSLEAVRCGLNLGESEGIADGEYLLTFSDSEGNPLHPMIKVMVKDEQVVSASEAKSSFSLSSGSGTEEDPYIIGSARDFLRFLDDLRENELTNGRNVWFRQTTDIELMDQSSSKPGRGYYGYSFAGHYDGGGYALKGLYYRGAENDKSDTQIGLFPALLDGACVENIVLSGVNISDTKSDTGSLAGMVSGSVVIDNIEISGAIVSENATGVGGLIGSINNGNNVTISDIKLKMAVTGKKFVGGIIGHVYSTKTLINRITTPNQHYSVEGSDCVGGVIGEVSNGEIELNDVTLTHIVSREDTDIRIIETTGVGYTGGLIGNVTGSATQLTARNIAIECPVGGLRRTGTKVGGIFGSVATDKDICLEGCKFTSMVSGDHEVGGYAGHFTVLKGARFIFNGDSSDNYILPDDSGAGVEGNTSVGGVFGYFEGASPITSPKSIRVAINVDGTDYQVGGLIGKTINSTIDLSVYNLSSSTMQVTGNTKVGGLVGFASGVTLTGGKQVSFSPTTFITIPREQEFEGMFIGTVKGKSEVGGVLGHGENVTLDCLASACTVMGMGDEKIGGIAGYIQTKGQGNRFESLVSRSEVKAPGHGFVGGIFGSIICDNYLTLENCINYGRVEGGNPTGGIVGYLERIWNNTGSTDGFKDAEMNYFVNLGEIIGADCVGGIVGKAIMWSYNVHLSSYSLMNFNHCGNHGQISSSSQSQDASGVGGIIGYGESNMKVLHCCNHGRIVSTEGHKGVGGIAGSLGLDPIYVTTSCMNAYVDCCMNFGTIDSQASSSRVGGILGFMEESSHMYNCKNSGEVLHKHKSDNGGILGYIDHLGVVDDCVNSGKVEYGNAIIGTHKTGSIFYHHDNYFLEGTGGSWPSSTQVSKADFSNQSKFPGLDFKDRWYMTDNNGPSLKGPFF